MNALKYLRYPISASSGLAWTQTDWGKFQLPHASNTCHSEFVKECLTTASKHSCSWQRVLGRENGHMQCHLCVRNFSNSLPWKLGAVKKTHADGHVSKNDLWIKQRTKITVIMTEIKGSQEKFRTRQSKKTWSLGISSFLESTNDRSAWQSQLKKIANTLSP